RKQVAALLPKLREVRERALRSMIEGDHLLTVQDRVVRIDRGDRRIEFCPVLEHEGSSKPLLDRLHKAREHGDPVGFLLAWTQLQVEANARIKDGARVSLRWVDGIIAGIEKMLEELPASAGARTKRRKLEVFQLLVRDYLKLTGRTRF